MEGAVLVVFILGVFFLLVLAKVGPPSGVESWIDRPCLPDSEVLRDKGQTPAVAGAGDSPRGLAVQLDLKEC